MTEPSEMKAQNNDVVRVDFSEVNTITRWPCDLCGGTVEKTDVLPEVADGAYEGFKVCQRCIQEGTPDETLTKRAESLERQAQALRQLVGRLVLPTEREYQLARLNQDARFCSDPDSSFSSLEGAAQDFQAIDEGRLSHLTKDEVVEAYGVDRLSVERERWRARKEKQSASSNGMPF